MTAIETSSIDAMRVDVVPGDPIGPRGSHATSRRRGGTLRSLMRSPLAVLSLIWIVSVVVASMGADRLAPYGPTDTDLKHVLSGPSADHWLGTDQLGRDVLSRLMHGGNDALLGAAQAMLVFVAIGVTLGVLAGYHGRWVDWLIMRWIDIAIALPAILILLVVLAVFPSNLSIAMVVLGVLASAGLTRIIRGETLRIREELFVSAARVSGLGDGQILRRHILSLLTTTILVQASVFAAGAIGAQAGLSFLGLGVQEPAPSWGGLVSAASQVLDRQPWLLVPAGGVIALTMLAFGLLGDALRDATVQQWSRSQPVGRPRTTRSAAPHPRELGPRTGDDEAEESSPTALLSVRGLTASFEISGVPTTVVDGVSFDLDRGETLGVVGESGCGKSVTVAAMLGLLPANADVQADSCRFDGIQLLSLTRRERASLRGTRIGYVSQDPMTALDPTTRAGDLLAEAVRHHLGLGRKAARARAVELLALVNIPEPEIVARRYPHQISGGMAQRVAIALALAGEPEVLVADEPTTALDVTVQAEILALIKRLQSEMGLAVILISHDWGVVARMCSQALVMYAGQVVERGPVRSLYHEPAHPYTAGLLAANPHQAIRRMEGDGADSGCLDALPTIPGNVPPPSAWPQHGCRFRERCLLATDECGAHAVSLDPAGPDHSSRCLHLDRVGDLTEEWTR